MHPQVLPGICRQCRQRGSFLCSRVRSRLNGREEGGGARPPSCCLAPLPCAQGYGQGCRTSARPAQSAEPPLQRRQHRASLRPGVAGLRLLLSLSPVPSLPAGIPGRPLGGEVVLTVTAERKTQFWPCPRPLPRAPAQEDSEAAGWPTVSVPCTGRGRAWAGGWLCWFANLPPYHCGTHSAPPPGSSTTIETVCIQRC